jgi:hypothetical protein
MVEKRRVEWTFCKGFERMEMSRDNAGRLES